MGLIHFFHRPMLSTLVTGASILFICYLFYYWPRRNLTFDFDPGERMGEFEKHAGRYQSLATLMLTICTAAVAFIINFLVNLPPDIKQRNSYNLRFEQAAPRTIAYLCLSAGCCVIFLLSQNLFYEDYVHAKYTVDPANSRETYTGARYAATLTISAGGFIFFLLAFIYLGWRLFD